MRLVDDVPANAFEEEPVVELRVFFPERLRRALTAKQKGRIATNKVVRGWMRKAIHEAQSKLLREYVGP